MFLRALFYLLLGLFSTKSVLANDIVLKNSETLQKVLDVELNQKDLIIEINLVNKSDHQDWYIKVPHPVEKIDLFTRLMEGSSKLKKNSLDTLFRRTSLKNNGYIFPISLQKGESKRYFLRLKNTHKLNTSVYIGTLKTIYEDQHVKNLAIGFIFGALLALMIYNFYIYLVTKDKTYIYYVAYIFFSILFLTIWNGYFKLQQPLWNLRLLTISSAALLIFSVLFTDGYLRTIKHAKILYKFRKWFWFAFLIPIAIDLLSYSIFAFQWLQISLILAIAYWVLSAYFSLRKGFKPAAFYLLALVFLLTSYIFYSIYHLAFSLPMGLLLQALTLSFMLAVKLNELKKENRQLQKDMMAQTSNFSKELINGQEDEKEQLAIELNESVGQQLVLLKNEAFAIKKQSLPVPNDLFLGITADIAKAIEEVSNVSFSLRPYQMNMLGLKQAIESLLEDIDAYTDTTIYLNIGKVDNVLPKNSEMNLYRITQELLNNLIKHADARQCWVTIKTRNNQLLFYYRDHGKGFDTENTRIGLGLQGIKERCNLMETQLNLVSRANFGTKILIKIPYRP